MATDGDEELRSSILMPTRTFPKQSESVWSRSVFYGEIRTTSVPLKERGRDKQRTSEISSWAATSSPVPTLLRYRS